MPMDTRKLRSGTAMLKFVDIRSSMVATDELQPSLGKAREQLARFLKFDPETVFLKAYFQILTPTKVFELLKDTLKSEV